MTRRSARGGTGLLATMTALLTVGVQGVAGAVLWTMSATPLTATVGVGTTITLTATNLDPVLGVKCVVAEIPVAIVPGDVWIVGSSTTANWVAVRSGQHVTAVIDGGDGNQKLTPGDWVSFAFSGMPVQAGAYAIHAVAYSGHDCVTGARALASPPVIVISDALVTPLPTPTPTQAPTPTPEPIVVLPPILPTPSPTPPAVTARPTPRATPAQRLEPQGVQGAAPAPAQRSAPPAATQASSPSPNLGSGTASAGTRGNAAADARPLALPRGEPADGEMALALGQLGIDGLGVWAIPGAVVGGPGLIVILWVAVQAGAAVAWVPAVRRLRGDGRFGDRAKGA